MSEPRPVDAARMPRPHDERAPVLQWVGLFLAPAAFFAHLQIGYVLIPWACTASQHVWVHVSGFLAIVLALLSAWAGWVAHGRAMNEQDDDGAGPVPRTRFLGTTGLCTSGLFVLLLVAQWAAGFIISPCQ